MGPIKCSRPGCQGIVHTTDPDHRRSGDLYFCDSECEKKYDNEDTDTPAATSVLPPQLPDDVDKDVFFLTDDAPEKIPTPEEIQERWAEIDSEKVDSEKDGDKQQLLFFDELSESSSEDD